MKAQTLAVCLPGSACDKKCPYCVSKMTWSPQEDADSWVCNIERAAHFARMAQVTDIIITGKGEPSINPHLDYAAHMFKEWPVVVQTNGIHWSKDPKSLAALASRVSIVSVSIDRPGQMAEYTPLWTQVDSNLAPMTCRATVMLTPEACEQDFMDWVRDCKKFGIRGLSFRDVTIPNEISSSKSSRKVADWIEEAAKSPIVLDWKHDFDYQFQTKEIIRRLPYGAVIKDFHGVTVTKFDYCIQDSNGEDDIRSLVYNQDGHLYTTWSSPASMIF